MKKKRIIKITRVASKLAFTAVLADLFYIIVRAMQPVRNLEDASFVCAVPEMLRLMLLSTVIVAAFLAAMTYIVKNEE